MQLELWPDNPRVTTTDVQEWVREIGFDPDTWRGRYYVRYWNVAEKIKAEKREALARLRTTPPLRGLHRKPPR